MKSAVRKTLFLICSLMLVVCFVFPMLLGFKEVKADKGVDSKKKNVVILFDNSGSMETDDRISYAKFSLRLLISLFSEKDKLSIVPMNVYNVSTIADKSIAALSDKERQDILKDLTVDLSVDREQEIKRILESGRNYGDGRVFKSYLDYCGSTPVSSLNVAIEQLKRFGMSRLDELNEAPDEEYWFIFLTDGKFDSLPNGGISPENTAKYISDLVAPYAGLHTIYWSLGKGDDCYDLSKVAGFEKSNISAFHTDNPSGMAKSAQEVANMISCRYPLDGMLFEVKNNTAILDLDSCGFPIRSISLLAQNIGAELKKVKHNDSDCKISTVSVSQGTKDGQLSSSITNINGVDLNYFDGGKIELEFSSAVSKNNLTFLVEPALYIDPVFSCSNDGGNTWVVGDEQYINANLKPNDFIKVDYVICESIYGRQIDPSMLSGSKTASVTYDGKAYSTGEQIKLTKGKKEVAVSVSLMGGIYTMYSTVMCVIEENPTYYRVESKLSAQSDTEYLAEYSVYDNNVILHESDFASDGYKCSLVLVDKNGQETVLPLRYENNGTRIVSDISITKKKYGKYELKFTVESPEGMVRTKRDSITYYPSSVEVSVKNPEITLSQYGLEKNQDSFVFELKSEGEVIPFEYGLYEYSLKIAGVDVTRFTTVSDDGHLYFSPNSENIGSISSLGRKDIKLSINCVEYPTLKDECSAALIITDTVYEVKCISDEDIVVDRYDINASKTSVYFTITRDGEEYTSDLLKKELSSGSIKVETNPFGWITALPANVDTFVTELDGRVVLCCKITSDIFSPLDNLLGAFIFPNEKDIKVEFCGVSATKTVGIAPVSFVSRVIRWVILLLIIYFIIHLLLWGIGFFVAQKLPKGVIVKVNLNAFSPDTSAKVRARAVEVNMNKKEIIIWHLKRFIPFCEFKDQKVKPTLCDYYDIKVNKTKVSGYAVLKKKMGRISVINKNLPNYKLLEEFKNAWAEKGKSTKFEMRQNEFKKMFRFDMKNVQSVGEEINDIRDSYYASYKEIPNKPLSGNPTAVVFFIKCK